MAISVWYQCYYITTARELARMVGIRKAPILPHFSESLTGAATIRCFNQEDRFLRKNLGLVDDYSRVACHNSATMEWLCVRINFLFNVVFFLVLVILVNLPRSAIAYEQCDCQCTDKFTSYAVFVDCLINTSTDADFLRDKRVVMPALSTEDVSILFNGLYNDTLVYDFYYGDVFREVNQYYRSQWPRWRAILKRDYFNNPWSIASFIAAIVILVLTFLQTLFTILCY